MVIAATNASRRTEQGYACALRRDGAPRGYPRVRLSAANDSDALSRGCKTGGVSTILATNWTTVSALATGVGTLVLAAATFASVRSSNRSARIAEVALQEQRRPILAPSRLEDPVQKVMFVDGHWLRAAGGHAVAEHVDGSVYLAISLRNVGSGIGVCQGWAVWPGLGTSSERFSHGNEEDFRAHTRDLYIPAGDIGIWQGALRNPDDPVRAAVVESIERREPISVELLYTDQAGLQRTITRFALVPAGDSRLASVNRHWYLDRDGPRPERDVIAATEVIEHDRDAATASPPRHDVRPAAGESEHADAQPPETALDR